MKLVAKIRTAVNGERVTPGMVIEAEPNDHVNSLIESGALERVVEASVQHPEVQTRVVEVTTRSPRGRGSRPTKNQSKRKTHDFSPRS